MTAGPTRKQKQKRRRRAVFLLLLAAVLCGVGFYCACVFCRASHIEVTGSTRYTAEDIIEAAGIGEEQNLFKMCIRDRPNSSLPISARSTSTL